MSQKVWDEFVAVTVSGAQPSVKSTLNCTCPEAVLVNNAKQKQRTVQKEEFLIVTLSADLVCGFIRMQLIEKIVIEGIQY